MNQFICQEDIDYSTVQSCDILFSPPTFCTSVEEYTISLPNGVCFHCFPSLALPPQKVASPYVHPIDLNNCE